MIRFHGGIGSVGASKPAAADLEARIVTNEGKALARIAELETEVASLKAQLVALTDSLTGPSKVLTPAAPLTVGVNKPKARDDMASYMRTRRAAKKAKTSQGSGSGGRTSM